VVNQPTLEAAVIHRVAARLAHPAVSADLLTQSFAEIVARDSAIGEAFRADLMAVADRDPACQRLIEPLLYFKGFHAIQAYRFAHALWVSGRKDFALYVQSRSSEVFQTDIHPNARLGRGLFLDHATGLVVGSTAVVEDNVSMLQDVTLGGTGKEEGDRHPKVRQGVLIGAGAKILGNIDLVDSPGHTPGHMSAIVHDGADQVAAMADVAHNRYIMFDKPEWTVAFDVDPAMAVKTRRTLFDRFAADNTKVFGYHMPWPALARITKRGDGYEWTTEDLRW
jgi:serine O-acetyltransferase